jgi:hypothetical protein
MALGITIRRWHLILAMTAGLLLYNFHGDKFAKIEEKKAEANTAEKCEGKTPLEAINTPREMGMYLSTWFGKEAPCNHAAELAAYILGNKGYGHLVGYGNGGYSHCMFVFKDKENGKWGAVDDGLYFKNGYLKPRFENVEKLLEYAGKNSKWGAFESIGLYKPTEIKMKRSLESLVDWKKSKEDS